ncbi:FtsX-like permease family protein [Paenibacillus algorifonticola]|uniref:ABC transporter permease n=1 Tax=Paenibacillus algorifonticola TaxID=684063 RepID=UPI003D2706D3
MYAVWTLCRSRLAINKTQNIFIALLLLLATLLIATAAILITNTGNLFADKHQKTHGSHQLLTLEKGIHDPQQVYAWWKAQTGVDVSKLLRYQTLSGMKYKGQDIPNMYLLMMDTPQPPFGVDELIFAEGTATPTPEHGTIWVPTSLAYTNGMAVGDTLQVQAGSGPLNLKISAFVVDIPYGAPFSNTARIWMNPQDYADQWTTAAAAGKDGYMIGLRFADYSEQLDDWGRFEQQWGTPYLESKMEFEEISSFYLIMNQVIGFIMIFLGIIMMLIALFTVGFTISDAILAHYKTIGVLKALGLSSSKMISTYVLQYGFLAILSIIPGLALSRFLSGFIMNLSLSSLKTGTEAIPVNAAVTVLAVGLLLFGLVVLCAFFYANKARNVQPVQAIRFGMSEADNNKQARRMGTTLTSKLVDFHLPLAAAMGLRNIFKNGRSSAFMIVLTVTASSVLVLGYILLASIMNIQQTAAKWGYDNANVAALLFNKTAFSQAKFEEALQADPRVKNFGWQANLSSVISSGVAGTETVYSNDNGSISAASSSISLNLTIVQGGYEQLGFETISGYNPRQKNEIALGVNAARNLGKSVGDTVDAYIAGHKQTLTVTGIYQAIANMSNSARVTADAVRAAKPAFSDMDVYFINAKNPAQSEALAQDLNTRYKASATVVTQQMLLDSVFKEATAILIYPMSLMGLLFMVVTFLITYSTCRIHMRKEGKTYGIYKSLGLTSFRIRLSITLGIGILSTLGALIGLLAGVYALPLLLETILSGYGIVAIPLTFSWAGVLVVSCLSIFSAALGSWASSKAIKQATPRILVME